MNTLRALLSLAVVAATSGAFAQTTSSIDPNTFRPGHPASPRWVVQHANAEHPAVLQSRAVRPLIDPNTFLVQPPAAVYWHAAAPAAPVLVAQAAR